MHLYNFLLQLCGSKKNNQMLLPFRKSTNCGERIVGIYCFIELEKVEFAERWQRYKNSCVDLDKTLSNGNNLYYTSE